MVIPVFSMLMPVCESLSRRHAASNAGRLLGLGGVGFTFSVSGKPVAGGVATGAVMAPLLSNVIWPIGVATTGGTAVGSSSWSYTSQVLSVAVFWKYRLTGLATPWLSNTLIDVP